MFCNVLWLYVFAYVVQDKFILGAIKMNLISNATGETLILASFDPTDTDIYIYIYITAAAPRA